ncbi:substrate-binding periplasmic protein [Pseudoalteromonas denitrificans]|uniref:Amino acid ABC transporter substrate-binding protein, PAAT family n=1 Tax=Pseudoalteromonas denitrificans DSM 6059 TaxID=1123010 RepID=A0A1I1KCW1_9GAMM|nr:transporter substrate-binding domain-containing protein [Pseudoalteromonas denitrificans]SFC58626.1 amino acid ABC transporter substrate-binding protein, PAAT family [Pseudoalteromonas denitrificans DSM 6059]
MFNFTLFFVLIVTNVTAIELNFVTENAPPLQYIKDGEISGKTTRIIKKVLEHAQMPAKISIYPWARAYQKALNGKNIFIYPLVRTVERENHFIWIGEILTLNLSWVKLSHKKNIKISKLEDVKRYKIGVMRGDATHTYLLKHGFEKNKNFIVVSELPKLLNLLYAEKIDSFIVDLDLLKEMALLKGYDEKKLISALEIPELKFTVYLAANIDTDLVLIDKMKHSLCWVMKCN